VASDARPVFSERVIDGQFFAASDLAPAAKKQTTAILLPTEIWLAGMVDQLRATATVRAVD